MTKKDTIVNSTTEDADSAVFLKSAGNPRPEGSKDFPREEWDSIRDSCLPPRTVTGLAGDGPHRDEFILGAELLRFSGPRAKKDKRTRELMTPRPAQLVIADAVENADRFMGLLAPRRSTKTSALFAIALGRIASRDDYRIGYSMATLALKARARFREDIAAPLEFLYPDKATRPFIINYAGGSESIRWKSTGSLFQFLAPKGDGFRSDAWDMILIDEAGEAEPEMTEDLLAGATATMDTIPDAVFIAMGTAGQIKKGGLLWPILEDGRAGVRRTSLLEWAADPETSVDDITDEGGDPDWDKASAILATVHPGIGHGSELADIEPNFRKPEDFLREYLNVFSDIGGSAFFAPTAWTKLGTDAGYPAIPRTARFGLAVNVDGSSASIAAAWRDKDKKAHVVLVARAEGTAWVQKKVLDLWAKYRIPFAVDYGTSATKIEVDRIRMGRIRVRMDPLEWADVHASSVLFKQNFEAGTLQHYNQTDLDKAVIGAKKRGTKDSKRWGYKAISDDVDVSPLEAAALALHAADGVKPKAKVEIYSA